MAADSAQETSVRLPRETTALFGHTEAERTLLDAYRSGRIPHAWLIGGERGIGKATLAYRMARFVLAHPDPKSPAVQKAVSLEIDPQHPAARRVASQSHSDLLVLERVINEKTGKLFTEIRVEDIRQTVSFFGSTAGEGGWRIAIVDPVEDLNRSGENALLKIVEEPPPRSLVLLVSHSPGRVLPTIRSRCRTLMLRPLATEDVTHAAAAALGEDVDESEVRAAAEASSGSVGRALVFLEGDALDLREELLGLLKALPKLDQRALHAVGEEISGVQAETLAAFMETVNGWMSAQLSAPSGDKRRLARVAAAWEKINESARDAEDYNLDRKPFVFSVFGALAEATRD